GSVDPTAHYPAPLSPERAALSYLGTYADDRQEALQRLFITPAKRRPNEHFVIGGAQYPVDFPWSPNIYFLRHVPPPEHPRFYASARATLNVTRHAMAQMGYCPSGRLFEAAACGAPILTDYWEGLESFFSPGREVLVVTDPDDVLGALDRSDAELAALAAAARERALSEHTAERRAVEMEAAFDDAWASRTAAVA